MYGLQEILKANEPKPAQKSQDNAKRQNGVKVEATKPRKSK